MKRVSSDWIAGSTGTFPSNHFDGPLTIDPNAEPAIVVAISIAHVPVIRYIYGPDSGHVETKVSKPGVFIMHNFISRHFPSVLFFMVLLTPLAASAQDATISIVVDRTEITLNVHQTTRLLAKVLDASGRETDIQTRFYSRSRTSVAVSRDGEVKALKSGTYSIFVRASSPEGQRITEEIRVDVLYPPIESITFTSAPEQVYVGTRVPLNPEVRDVSGQLRDDVDVHISIDNPSVATVDAFGHIVAHETGTVTITGQAEEATSYVVITVIPNPITDLNLSGGALEARTGDVIQYSAVAQNAEGEPVQDAPVRYAVYAQPDDDLGASASAQIDQDGRFVAETPGLYTIVASTGKLSTESLIRITPRDAARQIELVGKGIVSDVHTSDLWVWEGLDGRDYAVTGTWRANGEAYFWDVTNPASPTIIDTVAVDARTVNDVKVSEDGSVCVISREGASNRRNGLVILNCTDPHNVTTYATYDEDLTGGVHNIFIYDHHIYALSAGRRYDIISIEDPTNPHLVGSFELESVGHSIHDVWVVDGIAYSSNWGDGVYMVDVGNGVEGGSPSNPVVIGHYAYPSGWNHAAIPYRSKDTGKFYVIAADEMSVDDIMGGWVHFIDFTDPKNPKEVARYEVPEAGSHNLWIDGDRLYIAYYQGGLRVVDISGDLMGDLYKQGREVAHYFSADPHGHVPNAAMAWGPQVFKGNVFFSDMNSGLWIVKVQGDAVPDSAL